MIYDGACDCNERRVEGEPDFLTTFMAEVAEVVPRSLFRDPDGPAQIAEYDPRPSEMDLAILGSMAFSGIRRRLRNEAGIMSAETDSLELTASMEVAQRNPTMHHSTPEFLTLFEAMMAKMADQAQADAHVEDVRLEDMAEQERLAEYERDKVAEDNDDMTEDQAYLDACDACDYEDYEDGHRSPAQDYDYYEQSAYYDECHEYYDA